MAFEEYWFRDSERTLFWELVHDVEVAEKVRPVFKTVGPVIAANLVRDTKDLYALVLFLEDEDKELEKIAVSIVRKTLVALAWCAGELEVGKIPSAWVEFLERLTRNISAGQAYLARLLLFTLRDQLDRMPNKAERTLLNRAACRLVLFAVSNPERELAVLRFYVETICETLQDNLNESLATIELLLNKVNLQKFGYITIPALAGRVGNLVGPAPDMLRRIYSTAFSFEETSLEPTIMVPSLLMGMTSNKKQDYMMARYLLSEGYPKVIAEEPSLAIETLGQLTEDYLRKHRHCLWEEEQTVNFELLAQKGTLVPDGGNIHFFNTVGREYLLDMILKFVKHVESLVQEDDTEAMRSILATLSCGNRTSVLWVKVLEVFSRHPQAKVSRLLIPIFKQPAFYRCSATSGPLLQLLVSCWPGMTDSDHQDILTTASHLPSIKDGIGESVFKTLQALNEVREESSSADGQYYKSERVQSEVVTEDDRGPLPTRTRSAAEKLAEYVELAQDDVQVEEWALDKVLSVIREAASDARANLGGILEVNTWANVCRAYEKILEREFLPDEARDGIEPLLLELSNHENPSAAVVPSFDMPCWGANATRVLAARLLMLYARFSRREWNSVSSAILKLAADPVPSVRFQIATHLSLLKRVGPDAMLRIGHTLAKTEPTGGVLQGLFHAAKNLADDFPAEVGRWAITLLSRGIARMHEEGTWVSLLLWLAFRKRDVSSISWLNTLAKNPSSSFAQANGLAFWLRGWLVHEASQVTTSSESEEDLSGFHLAWNLANACSSLIERHRDVDVQEPLASERLDQLSGAILVLDSLAHCVFFATKELDEGEGTDDSSRHAVFFTRVRPVLNTMTTVGISKIAHAILETLDRLIRANAAEVLVTIAQTLKASQPDGYQTEPAALRLVQGILEKYLTTHRGVLCRRESRQAISDIFDTLLEMPKGCELIHKIHVLRE